MPRDYNFSAGPAVLPEEVLSQAEGPGEEAPPEPPARKPDFSFEELDLHLGEEEPDLRDEEVDQ